MARRTYAVPDFASLYPNIDISADFDGDVSKALRVHRADNLKLPGCEVDPAAIARERARRSGKRYAACLAEELVRDNARQREQRKLSEAWAAAAAHDDELENWLVSLYQTRVCFGYHRRRIAERLLAGWPVRPALLDRFVDFTLRQRAKMEGAIGCRGAQPTRIVEKWLAAGLWDVEDVPRIYSRIVAAERANYLAANERGDAIVRDLMLAQRKHDEAMRELDMLRRRHDEAQNKIRELLSAPDAAGTFTPVDRADPRWTGSFPSNECVICRVAPPCLVLLPCRHQTACTGCAVQCQLQFGNTCPLCRAEATQQLLAPPLDPTQAMLDAIDRHDPAGVMWALTIRGVDATAADDWALRWAADSGHAEVVRSLLAREEVNPAARNNAPLHLAARNGHTEIVALLLAREEVNPAARNNAPLHLAARNGHTEIVALLLAREEVNPAAAYNCALCQAAHNGHIEIVELLLARKEVDPAADDNYALRWAAFRGHLEVVRRLLARKEVDPAADDDFALRWAAELDHLEIVKLLLARKEVDPAARDNYALREAARSGYLEIVKLLLAREEVDPAAADNYALRWAASNGHLEVVRRLLARKEVDPAADDNYALRWAANYGHLEIVELLLAREGVDPAADDNFALRGAAENGFIEIVELLQAHKK